MLSFVFLAAILLVTAGTGHWILRGYKMTTWKAIKSKDETTWQKGAASYNEYAERYLSNRTSGQIVDGLNSFYEDYRNRTIAIDDAVWVVLRNIADHESQEECKVVC